MFAEEVKLNQEQTLRVIKKDMLRAEGDPYKITKEQFEALEAIAKLLTEDKSSIRDNNTFKEFVETKKISEFKIKDRVKFAKDYWDSLSPLYYAKAPFIIKGTKAEVWHIDPEGDCLYLKVKDIPGGVRLWKEELSISGHDTIECVEVLEK